MTESDEIDSGPQILTERDGEFSRIPVTQNRTDRMHPLFSAPTARMRHIWPETPFAVDFSENCALSVRIAVANGGLPGRSLNS